MSYVSSYYHCVFSTKDRRPLITPQLRERLFRWQEEYGAFAVSVSLLDRTLAYVRDQAEHHQKRTYQQEFLALLNKHRIPYDERYLWT